MLTVVASASLKPGDVRRHLADDGWERLGRGWLWTGPDTAPVAAYAVALLAEAEAAPRMDPPPGRYIPRPTKPSGVQPPLVIGGSLALRLLGCALVPNELATLLVTPPGTSGVRRTSAVRQRAPLTSAEWVVRNVAGVTGPTTTTGRQPLPWLTLTSPARSAQDAFRQLRRRRHRRQHRRQQQHRRRRHPHRPRLTHAGPQDLRRSGPLLPQVQLLWVLEQLLRRHGVDLTEGASRRVRRALAPLVAMADPASRSPLETATRRLLVDGGCPAPESNLEVLEGVVCDLVWQAHRVIVECDGLEWHPEPSVVVKDARRHGALRRADWTVVRVTWDDLRDPPVVGT